MSRFFGEMAGKDMCSYDRSYHDNNKAFANYRKLVLSVSKDYPDISIVDLSERFCDDRKCYIAHDDKLFYKDNNHLNFTGSLYVAPYLMQMIRKNAVGQDDMKP